MSVLAWLCSVDASVLFGPSRSLWKALVLHEVGEGSNISAKSFWQNPCGTITYIGQIAPVIQIFKLSVVPAKLQQFCGPCSNVVTQHTAIGSCHELAG